jgi:hypothetical protein
MKVLALCSIASVLAFSGCEEKKEVVVSETRPLTTRDETPKLDATPDERFRDAKPSPVKAETPDGWLALPASQFRLLNYRFGETGMGEVWVSIASGTVLDNVNRWLHQFGAEPVDAEGMAKLPTMMLAGSPGVWVSAAGDYVGGMGAPPKPGFALAGVVADAGGRILTVKMVGPKAEVEAAKPVLETYIRSVRLAE